MTDDKGEGEGAMNNPYDHEDCDSDFGGCGDKCKRGAYEDGYNAGRKAERERCLAIVNQWRRIRSGPMAQNALLSISDEIGGQDAK